jgi:hypothetical protein
VSNARIIGEKGIGKDFEESGRDLIEVPPGSSLEGLRKATKTSVRISEFSAEIRTLHFPNTNLEPSGYTICPVLYMNSGLMKIIYFLIYFTKKEEGS